MKENIIDRVERDHERFNVAVKVQPLEDAKYQEIRRRCADWSLIDVDTLSLEAARDMVAEMRKAARALVGNAEHIIGQHRRELRYQLARYVATGLLFSGLVMGVMWITRKLP